MGNTWVINILHGLDEDGNLIRAHGPGRRIVEYFCSIVEQVTLRPRDEDDLAIPIMCRRRPGHKQCLGMIVAGYAKEDPNTIVWECLGCGDNGSISGWLALRSRRLGWRSGAGNPVGQVKVLSLIPYPTSAIFFSRFRVVTLRHVVSTTPGKWRNAHDGKCGDDDRGDSGGPVCK